MSPAHTILSSALPTFLTSPTSTVISATPTNTFILITPTVAAFRMRLRPSPTPVTMDLLDELDGYKERLCAILESLETPHTPLTPRTSFSSSFMDNKMAFVMPFVILLVAYVVVQWWMHGAFLKAGKGKKKDERREMAVEETKRAIKGLRKEVMEMGTIEERDEEDEDKNEGDWEDEE